MDEYTAAEAAAYLGITREAVDAAAREGRLPALDGDGPRRFSRGSVEAYHQARVGERIAALARSRETPVSVAARVRKALHADEMGMPRPFDVKLKAMPDLWRSVFSKAELAAACATDGCRWCDARKFTDFLGLRPVEFSPALRELFATDPCQVCAPVLLGPYMAALSARVHAGDRRPPAPPPPPSEADRKAAREWAVRHPVTAAEKPVGDDDGRAFVAKRLRQARGQLKAAKRAGDQRRALQLAKTVRQLEADASVVDGRAAAPRGRKACGTPVGARCECHTSDRRGQR